MTVDRIDEADEETTFLLCPFGSAGDVYPFLGLALRLQSRGHKVIVMTSGYFQETAERLGLEFVDGLSRERFLELVENPDLWHPWRGAAAVLETVRPEDLRSFYELVKERYVPGKTIAITSVLGFAVRMAHDKLDIPLLTVDLQPLVLWSKYESPIIPGLWKSGPAWFKQLQFRIGTAILGRILAPRLNPFRAELDLPPIKDFYHWMHSPLAIIGLYPPWYAPPQPDWPPQVRLTQFPLWDENADEPLPERVETFLQAGDPPIVFTPGSANVIGHDFFAASAEACRRLGRRGMLFTRFPKSVPDDLPAGVEHFEYAPFTKLLPRVAAIAHHGGIGTTSAALAAGIPQLIMPFAHDQPDNLLRLQKLGVGDGLLPKKYQAPAVAKKLQYLLESPEVQSKCAEIAARFAGLDPYAEIVEAVESFL